MHLRQVAVEDDDVVVVEARLLEAAEAVQGRVDGHALLAQPARDRAGESFLVLDDEYAHRTFLDLPGINEMGVRSPARSDSRSLHVGRA